MCFPFYCALLHFLRHSELPLYLKGSIQINKIKQNYLNYRRNLKETLRILVVHNLFAVIFTLPDCCFEEVLLA